MKDLIKAILIIFSISIGVVGTWTIPLYFIQNNEYRETLHELFRQQDSTALYRRLYLECNGNRKELNDFCNDTLR